MRYALVADGMVENIIWVENPDDYDPGEKVIALATDEVAIGWLYVNGQFEAPPPPPEPRKLVAKSVVQQRIIDKGPQYMTQALEMLQSNAVYFARWFAPDHPAVYCDDPDAIGLVNALGLDPNEILAPE